MQFQEVIVERGGCTEVCPLKFFECLFQIAEAQSGGVVQNAQCADNPQTVESRGFSPLVFVNQQRVSLKLQRECDCFLLASIEHRE